MLVNVEIQSTEHSPAEPLILSTLYVHRVILCSVSPLGRPGLHTVLSVGFIGGSGDDADLKLVCDQKQGFDRVSAVLLFVQRVVREVALDSGTDCTLCVGVYGGPL